MARPLGFSNQYGLGLRRDLATRLGIATLSDLARHPELRLGVSEELLSRSDGWPALARAYGLAPRSLRALDHDVAYRALGQGELDVVDVYTTDAELEAYGLVVVQDDRGLFARYDAVFLYRQAAARAWPSLPWVLDSFAGALPAEAMIALNRQAKLDHVDEGRLANQWLSSHPWSGHCARGWVRESRWRALARNTRDHVLLVALSLTAAIALSIPLGILCARNRTLGRLVLALGGLLQTIPSLALLVFMIPLVGIGPAPAIFALFLYSLLPIVRATYTGLRGLPPALMESAQALGLPRLARLCRIELPMASRSILSGVKTAAVINVGTATLGAIVGAGGYGQPILSGVRLASSRLILEGAVPAAVMALAVEGLFTLAELVIIPRGLRLPPRS
jgi:osmoprotectant transport system permease protein